MFLHKTPPLLKALFPKLLWRKDTKEKRIYLTFDDGPIPRVTEFVLETLHIYHAKATFFCVGDNIRKHPDIFDKILWLGHAVGNHTYNHINGWKTDSTAYEDNVEKCHVEMMKHTENVGKRLFRPPYGRIKPAQIKNLKKDYQIVMWDVLSGDYSQGISKEECLKSTINATSPGSIVVFHDNVKAESHLQYALPKYLEHFAHQGYTFSKL
ncbi:MAG: polysaccharide deacetylase family protein [Bacteroidota bacterium]